MGWDFRQGDLYKVSDVYDKIVHGIAELEAHEQEYEKYNSPNGWGTTESALRALKSLKECIDGVAGEIGYWPRAGWNEIPKEYLYVVW